MLWPPQKRRRSSGKWFSQIPSLRKCLLFYPGRAHCISWRGSCRASTRIPSCPHSTGQSYHRTAPPSQFKEGSIEDCLTQSYETHHCWILPTRSRWFSLLHWQTVYSQASGHDELFAVCEYSRVLPVFASLSDLSPFLILFSISLFCCTAVPPRKTKLASTHCPRQRSTRTTGRCFDELNMIECSTLLQFGSHNFPILSLSLTSPSSRTETLFFYVAQPWLPRTVLFPTSYLSQSLLFSGINIFNFVVPLFGKEKTDIAIRYFIFFE